VKHARELLRKRKAREQHRQFVVEGVRMIEEAHRAGIRPALFFYVPAFLASAEGRRLAEDWRGAGETVSDKVLASISDTVTPQGVLAVVPYPQLAAARRALVLVLDSVRDPGNSGTLLRSAAAAGVDEVLIGPGSADPFNAKVVRAAMGAHFRVAVETAEWAEIARRVAGLDVVLAEAAGELDYDRHDWRRPSALIVGGEAEGASAEGRALARRLVRIPMRGGSESLNAAVAGSIILFEAARQRRGRV
jgi:TrmH family RNA methyltransferase